MRFFKPADPMERRTRAPAPWSMTQCSVTALAQGMLRCILTSDCSMARTFLIAWREIFATDMLSNSEVELFEVFECN